MASTPVSEVKTAAFTTKVFVEAVTLDWAGRTKLESLTGCNTFLKERDVVPGARVLLKGK